MAPHSTTLAWKIPWMEEPGRLQSMGLLRVRHDWATSLSLFTHWRRKWQPTPVFLPGESQGQGSLVGCRLWGSHRVGHDWSDLAAATATASLLWYSIGKKKKKKKSVAGPTHVLRDRTMHVRAKLLHSCPTLCDPSDCSLPGSFLHGIIQARILE